MKTQTVTITNETGLHARPASLFVEEALKFKAEIFVDNGTQKMSAKSILNILCMAISKGQEITISADGEDEEQALTSLVAIIKSDLDE